MFKRNKSKIIDIPVEQIEPYPNNAKIHDGLQIDKIKESIVQFGFRGSLLVTQKDDKYEIVCGHGRYYALRDLGRKMIPCEVITDLDEKQIKAFRLLDNKVAEGDYNLDMFREEYHLLREDYDFEFFTDTAFMNSLWEVTEEQVKTLSPEVEVTESLSFKVECSDEESRKSAIEALFDIKGVSVK